MKENFFEVFDNLKKDTDILQKILNYKIGFFLESFVAYRSVVGAGTGRRIGGPTATAPHRRSGGMRSGSTGTGAATAPAGRTGRGI